jgi:DNA mismatch repair protein MutS
MACEVGGGDADEPTRPSERPNAMTFQSILYRQVAPDLPTEQAEAPEFFKDLNFDQIVAAVTTGKEEYDLKPFFYRQLLDIGDIGYRHEVMKDLEDPSLFQRIGRFAGTMREMRRHLEQAKKLYYQPQKNAWFLDAVAIYCEAVEQLAADLEEARPESRGFRGFQQYLTRYIESEPFKRLAGDMRGIKANLHLVKYCVVIRGLSVTVRGYADESDYSEEIEETFKKFRQSDVKDYRVDFSDFPDMNHIENQIIGFVAKLYPQTFADLEKYCIKYRDFADAIVVRFDREIQFYVSYLEYIGRLKRAGLRFCYPIVGRDTKEVRGSDVFDLALATKLVSENSEVVPNDLYLNGSERVFAVSGPNQGGKTTFARTFGQLHYLASLGCLVPGYEAQLFFFDRMFTHFEKEEDITNLRGKLQDDLLRIRGILDQATPNSLVIMNEIFSSTALEDAVFLATQVMQRILDLDCLCVCVSFLDELAGLSDRVVSMVSTVVPENPALRTFKLVRRPADGRAYAISIAEKYRLTYQSVRERIAS